MKRIVTFFLPLALLLIGLPLCGVWLAGRDVDAFLEFPPRTRHVEHAPFSWPVFIGLAVVILAVMVPFLVRVIRGGADAVCPGGAASAPPAQRSFPPWGWMVVGFGVLFWLLAWTRFGWMEPVQLYTFTPQWIAYIVVVNALTWRKTGRCLLTHETRFFLWLFPLSAVFWWFFEYLNRFVQNWWYTSGADFTPLQYFIAATLPFATVLPAVLSTEEWLAANPRTSAGLEFRTIIWCTKPKRGAWITLLVSGLGLLFIGWFPDYLFPLLWVAPLLLLMAFGRLANQPSFFPELEQGDWRRIYRLALAALICGFFWELWNWHSLAKWIYEVPFVHRFQVFEMPLLGYAGYLPFGLECAVIADLIRRRHA
ncbi:hypothetical protein PDESU_05652 [Pontiella desulfatans]|uniref:Mechanosensitive ion channel protein MscS n=1 Tax=Pontiella desulfatans TaxID=2750659 RepID=A0A6C2UAD0_PONDE|nr:hypothetical protein [Pontiella desulfatans]VGO17058.1 hypothetical protein PDESU_05652 [Pontiella desulfatans]